MKDDTYYICQSYRYKKTGKKRLSKELEQESIVECSSASAAKERAQRMMKIDRVIGVDAFAVKVDEEMGDYSDPTFLLRLGEVPAFEGA